jgi:hypothetical protein
MPVQKMYVATILAVAILGSAGALVFALLSTNATIMNTGNIKAIGVGVYSDSACSDPIALIEWETVDPGTTRDFTIYIKNEGNINIILSMATTNWDPTSATNYMTLSWNREGYLLTPGSSVQAIFSLSVSSSISGVQSFSFDIVLTGTESS